MRKLLLIFTVWSFSALSATAWASSDLEYPILGEWQTVNSRGKTTFISIIVDAWGNLKVLPCHRTVDSNYNPSDIVVCSAKPKSGHHLKYSSRNETYTISQQAMNYFSLQNEILIEKALLGWAEVHWIKANEKFTFLYNRYTDYE